ASNDSPAALRAQATDLFERRAHATREGGIALDPLQADLAELAAKLETAGLDSLASDARYFAANLLSRLGRRTETDRQLLFSIADAVRAHDESRAMRGRLWQADLAATRDPSLAIRTAEDAIPRLREMGADDLLGNAYSTIARALTELGRLQDAYTAARHAIGHYALAGDLPGQLWAQSQCSQALRYIGRHDEARALTDSSVVAASAAHLSRPLSRALLERASIERTSGHLPEALAAVNQALEEDRRRGDAATSVTSRTFRARILFSMRRVRECVAETDTLLGTRVVQQSITTRAHVSSIRARALAAMSRAEEADSLLSAFAEEFERHRAALATDEDRASTGEHAAELFATWTRVRLMLHRDADAWRVSERGRAVALRSRLGFDGLPTLAEVQTRVARTHAALIAYDLVDPEMGNVFVITAKGVAGAPLDGQISEGDLEALLDRSASLEANDAPDSAAIRIAQVLFGPLTARLSPEIERLFVVPPSSLERVPFDALPDLALAGRGSAAAVGTLGDRFAISYPASAAVLLGLDSRPPPAHGFTVLADPVIDASQSDVASLDPVLRGAVLRPLPGARAEARELSDAGASVFAGREATLKRLQAHARVTMLHFATHAFDDPHSPSGGGLMLAGVPAVLTPAAVESLGISADLVTLSGCSTLGAVSYSGEGTFGLARSFLIAGSRSVVSTRWDVSDRAASRFMRELYAALRAGEARDQALRRARAALAREDFVPRDYNAFMLTGVGDEPIARWAAPGASSSPGRRVRLATASGESEPRDK
ncbi:MAG: CHAT domain-containing protein, partial [Candidatus Eiseniibacteriota bacterium]